MPSDRTAANAGDAKSSGGSCRRSHR